MSSPLTNNFYLPILLTMERAFLTLENGEFFEGLAPIWQQGVFGGEVVFTTGMTGYCESLTDPSYFGQILTFTYPLIGNYGVPEPSLWESKKVHASGVIVGQSASHWSHHLGICSLANWLQKEKVPLLTGVDTRALTKMLRVFGTMRGVIAPTVQTLPLPPIVSPSVTQLNLDKPRSYGKGTKRVIAVDCGMKENLMRMLLQLPIEIVRVPYDYDYSQESFDGVFLSNGPGDPTECVETIAIVQKAMQKQKPIFGVCLGNQLLALAGGANTYKLRFGHRGQNQPCMDVETQKCYVTSQNHGYAIAASSLPPDWKVTWSNLNDGSVEGISHRTLPFSAVQFHPEAAPGPTDTRFLFERFYACL